MAGLVTDTHALVWFLEGSSRISGSASATMQATVIAGDSIRVPTICLVEVIYLVEKGRLPRAALDRILAALDAPEMGLLAAQLDRGVAHALSLIGRDAVPDMPDRIIAATALHLGLPLISRDRKIRASGIQTIW